MSELAESERAEAAPAQAPAQKPKRRRRIIIFCVVSLVNVGLLVVLLSQLLTPASNVATDPLVGHPAPNFSLAALHPGGSQSMLSLADFKGKPVLLNFWATWCAPCKEELPLLEKTWKQEQAQGKDVVFLGLDFQEGSSNAASFVRLYGISYQILLDTDGAATLKYGITGLPQTVFINRQGVVVSKVPGELTAKTLASGLQSIL
ncbi:MAG TPA: TlpA disulfide reductase family protein [Ktedonobacterales bacterium]|nr:TlpA disulfide reductase family protein [Ktedonobacterales bacterium]